jgi:leucyl aminopeptidase
MSTDSAATAAVDAVVIGIWQGAAGPVVAAGADGVDAALGGRLAAVLADLGVSGKEGEVTRFPSLGATTAAQIVAVGLGRQPAPGPDTDAEPLRRAAGSAVRALAGVRRVLLTLPLANAEPGPDDLRAVAEGALLGAYTFTRYRTREAGKAPVAEVVLATTGPTADGEAALRRAHVVAAAVSLVRDLVNTAPADLPPVELAAAAVAAADRVGVAVEVLDEDALRTGGYGGILGVGQGSANPPRLVRLAHQPAGATRTVVLVGKGITFDSGGLSLKPAPAMEWMKMDMGGAAAVVAAVTAAAELELPLNVIGYAPTAENLPSGAAIRPSDVLTMYGGTRVEVMNTDAEGRLVLADALVRAGEDSPDFLVDVATLTGAQLVALGSRVAGVMGTESLREQVVAASRRAGEAMWPMPLPPELRASLDSDVADLKNTGDRNGGMLTAGLFLQEFVPADVPWAHIDIAGPAFNLAEPWGYTGKGGTGAAVRTLVQLLEDLATDAA